MVTSSKRTYASRPQPPGLLLSVTLTWWRATVDPHLYWVLLDTHRQVWLSLLGVTAPFFRVLVCTGFYVCPPRVCFPVLWKFCDQIPLTFKVRFHGDSQALCQMPRLGNLLWDLKLSQQCENFFGIVYL